jgi:hypothetical protein
VSAVDASGSTDRASEPAPAGPAGTTTACTCAGELAELRARLDAIERERATYFVGERELPLPVEPIYSVDTVLALVPCARRTLYGLMRRHPELFQEPLYRANSTGRRYRMLRASEVRAVRAKMIYRRRPGRGAALASIKRAVSASSTHE